MWGVHLAADWLAGEAGGHFGPPVSTYTAQGRINVCSACRVERIDPPPLSNAWT